MKLISIHFMLVVVIMIIMAITSGPNAVEASKKKGGYGYGKGYGHGGYGGGKRYGKKKWG